MFSDWLHKWLSCGFTLHACPHRHYPYLSFAGIKIILDFVPNHTSDQHEWFLRSEAGDPKYENFYIWHDGLMVGDERKPPNNWISVFRGPAWEWSEKRQQFYFHQFAKQQVRDLDFNFFFCCLDRHVLDTFHSLTWTFGIRPLSRRWRTSWGFGLTKVLRAFDVMRWVCCSFEFYRKNILFKFPTSFSRWRWD